MSAKANAQSHARRWAEAACIGADPDLFFPGKGRNDDCAEAKAICAGCPVRDECLEAGMSQDFGIWGGTTERERRRLRRLRAAS
jgi:WhiB family redox-sensing transcriptional regulator